MRKKDSWNRFAKVPIEDRFWQNADVLDEDDCWNWKLSKDRRGYGYTTHNGRTIKAHRMAYILTYGIIPDGLMILHKCDNPSCVNPKHLFLGTSADNMRDMVNKGRSLRGNLSKSAKLSESDVVDIKHAILNGESRGNIAKRYGVTKTCISMIGLNKSWSWLSSDAPSQIYSEIGTLHND